MSKDTETKLLQKAKELSQRARVSGKSIYDGGFNQIFNPYALGNRLIQCADMIDILISAIRIEVLEEQIKELNEDLGSQIYIREFEIEDGGEL